MDKNYVQICPRCGSTKVKNILLVSPTALSRPGAKKLKEQMVKHPISAPSMGWQPENQSVFICEDCDYNGICPEIAAAEVAAFRKGLQKKYK